MRAIANVITWVLCLAILIVLGCLLVGYKRHPWLAPGSRTLLVAPGTSAVQLATCSNPLSVDVDDLIGPQHKGEPVWICGNDVVEWTAQESFTITVQNAPPSWKPSTVWSCTTSGQSQNCTCSASSSPYACTSQSFPACDPTNDYLECPYWYYKYGLLVPTKGVKADPHVIMIP